MNVAETIAQRSMCSRAKVGCVIVDQDQTVLAVSYNGPPPGSTLVGECFNWCQRAISGHSTPDYSNCPSSHAEINAIARMPKSTKALTAYVNRLCCLSCAKALAAASVSRVVCKKTDIDEHLEAGNVRSFLVDLAGMRFEEYATTQ